MKIECSDHMGQFIMGILKSYAQETDADLYEEACEMVKKAKEQEKPLLTTGLDFVYRGQHFELANMVALSNQRLRDKSYGDKTFGGYLHDKYALFAVHNDIAEDKDTCPDVTSLFIQWWFGSDDDLAPGKPVPEHVLHEIDERWDEIQRALYGIK